jgi:hypothetical protein
MICDVGDASVTAQDSERYFAGAAAAGVGGERFMLLTV